MDQQYFPGDEPADPAEDLYCAVKTGRCSCLAAANAGWKAGDERLPADQKPVIHI